MKLFAATPSFWRDRLRASAIHLCLSALVALLAGLLVFAIWYPYPYRDISGGRELFFLVVTVDVILGPLITLAVFNRRKPWSELRRDLWIVALIQLAALGYGLWTVYAARPVYMVFEYDRFRVVHAVDIDPALLAQAPNGLRNLPLLGPGMLALRPFKDAKERMDVTIAALEGLEQSTRADFWQPYADAVPEVLKAAKPVAELSLHLPAQAPVIERYVRETGRSPEALVYLPLVSRKLFWTALLDARTGVFVAAIPVDPY